MAIGFVTAFPMILALMFGVRDIDAVLGSNLPSAEIFYQITQSRGITTFIMCWVVLLYYSTILHLSTRWASLTLFPVAIIGQWVTSGRMTWAFSRDVGARARATLAGEDANQTNQRGIPYSEFFSHVDVYRDFPLRATVLSICFCCLYGLLYLASTTAFNSIVTGAVLYLVSISFLRLAHPRD